MKTLVKNYTFNKTAKQITITNLTSVTLEQLLLITNVTDGIILYNFADSTKGATVSGNVITLEYDTSAMSDTDNLQIFLDIPNSTDLQVLGDLLIDGFASVVSELQAMKVNQGLPDPRGLVRVTVAGNNGSGGYLDTVSTVSNIGSYNATVMNMSQTNMGMSMLRQNIKIYGGSI